MSTLNDIKKNLYASSIATCIAELITLPICTIKTYYQNTLSNSITKTTKEIYYKNGIKSFYKASFSAISSQIISTSSKYILYKYLEDMNLRYSNKFINGGIAGIISTIVTHPLDTIRVHQQMQKNFISELKNQGLKLFYRGYSKSFTKIIIGNSLYFPLYDYSLNFFENNSYSFILAGFTSSLFTTIIIHPIDYFKTRQIYGNKLYYGINPFNYYKGLTINLIRVVPHFIITMYLIDSIKK